MRKDLNTLSFLFSYKKRFEDKIKLHHFLKYWSSKSGRIGIVSLSITAFFLLGVTVAFSFAVLADVAPSGISVFNHTIDCWQYDGNYSGCVALGGACNWLNNSASPPQNSFCPINISNFNTTWSSKTGNALVNAGCCSTGGQSQGCWAFDGNQAGCQNDSTCDWRPNDANQNSWCPNSVGCCQKKGCWSFTTSSDCSSAFGGLCVFSGGFCYDKSCNDVSDVTNCTNLINQFSKPCAWNVSGSNACTYAGGQGGFGFYNNTDSCISQGGWWNGTSCVLPGSGGGGGFLFAQEARCWFADNKPNTCQNVTGCVYCTNTTTQINNASSACYNFQIGLCQGHEPRLTNWNGTATVNVTDINTSAMTCGDIRLKQTCLCGPLPNCVWTNSSTITGNYCTSGAKSDSDRQACVPPAQFCEDSKAKNNETLCNSLASDYMMPCKWDNLSNPAKNCTFNSVACFGGGAGVGSYDYTSVSTENQCMAAGGNWKTEYYQEGGSLKQDSWCEKGALYSFVSGKAFANKGNCDSDCWACEFNASGSTWVNVSTATSACLNSKKGICKWENDSNAPNGLGWCDYPDEIAGFGGSQDCHTECKACEFSQNRVSACYASVSGCTWINDSFSPNGQGFCISTSKESCGTDCFSCYEQSQCVNVSVHPNFNCSWDPSYYFCKPFNFAGEICFNGKDDDSDTKSDCLDPDCSFDQFCGGGSIGNGTTGVDCKAQTNLTLCAISKSSSGKNCTVVTPTWGGQQYCDFPGSNCWQYSSNASGCTTGIGCVWKNATSTPAFPGFCEINRTAGDFCFNATNFNNQTNCGNNAQCRWINYPGGGGGRCEFRLFSQCGNLTSESACCSGGNCVVGGGNCTWRNDSFSFSGGFCEPICFAQGASQIGGLNSSQCGTAGSACSFISNTCEPDLYSGISTGGHRGCHEWDNNYTGCSVQNFTCGWINFTLGNMSQGACDFKGQQLIFKDIDQSPPKILGFDLNDTALSELDIRGFGVKEMTNALAFGIMVSNVTNGSVCRGYYIQPSGFGGASVLGNGSATTKFYWYLDTNRNVTDGCNATHANATADAGYEFLMKYVVSLSNGSVVETKSFHKCSSGNWVLTNVPLSTNRQMMCGMTMPVGNGNLVGGVMVLIDKESLESFSAYNKTAPMRVFVTSANTSGTEYNPTDSSLGPGYYTSGSADFKFVDCSNPDVKDPKCKNFQKFGFNVYEDCKNGIDDDADGLTDCSDPKCSFTPNCGSSGFSFTANPNDQLSPAVSFTQVDSSLPDASFVKFDTNEPSNGSVEFYRNDSTCGSINVTLRDLGDPSVSFDDYKPFHGVTLEQSSLGYGLTNGTTYFYKTVICDPSNNCASSACLNFTTRVENSYKNFVFKIKLPSGYNATLVGAGGFNYSGNFTTIVDGKSYETGIKANASVTRNMNLTVNCGTQSLTFVGVDILKPKSIDLSTAFVCDSSSNVLGMNSTSKSWNQVVSDLSMGGQSDYLKLTFPLTYAASNNISWCDDALTNCTVVNSFANCSSAGGGRTDCKVPTSLGFSAYKVTTPSSGNTGGTTGGGGGGGAATGAKTYSITSSQLSSGYTQTLARNDKVKFPVGGDEHIVTVTGLTATSITISIASTPSSATLSVGQTVKSDVDDDGVDYDVQVTLNSINSAGTNASITLQSISELITAQQPGAPAPAEQPSAPSAPAPSEPVGEGGTGTGLATGEIERGSGAGFWLIAAVVIIIGIAWAVVLVSRKKR